MRYKEFRLVESRGVTARDTGEVYVSTTNPNNTLAIQQILVVKPEDAPAFEDKDQMLAAVAQNIPENSTTIEDNKPSTATKAAIIAHCINQDDEDEWHVRYIAQVPATGVHGLWKTFAGYQYAKAAKQESVPIKPSDLILDDQPRNMDTLITDLKTNLERTLAGTEHSQLTEVMNKAIDLAAQGKVEPIENGANYLNVIAKYGGEYLGIIAIAKGGVRKGDIDKMLDSMQMPSLVGSTVIFPQDVGEELVDSYLLTPNGTRLGVSTKMHKGGGAASSLSGVVKQLNADIEKKFPKGSNLIKLLGTSSAFSKDPSKAGSIGIVRAARDYGIINDEDIVALTTIDPGSQDVESIKAKNLYRMTKSQGVDPTTLGSPDYRVYFHALAAIANDLIIAVNKDQDFKNAMMAALNNNNYLQMLTDVRKRGDAITCDYYGKFPAVFEGSPVLYNKVYYATGQKGRIGFKLKK